MSIIIANISISIFYLTCFRGVWWLVFYITHSTVVPKDIFVDYWNTIFMESVLAYLPFICPEFITHFGVMWWVSSFLLYYNVSHIVPFNIACPCKYSFTFKKGALKFIIPETSHILSSATSPYSLIFLHILCQC